MTNPKIRVGIIGQGRSGRGVHADHIVRLPEKYKIVAVSDALAERREMAIRDYGCEAYEDYQDMLKRTDLDLIVNATPSHFHVPVSIELLEKGFHVLCEKPLARTVAEVDQLIAAAKKAGKVLTVMHQRRFDPMFRQIQSVVASGVLGRLVQVSIRGGGFARRWDWQTLKAYNGGTLLNTGAHFLDQATELYAVSGTPNVICMMDSANSFGDAEDYCKIVLRQPNQPVVDLEIDTCTTYPGPNYSIKGTNGGLEASGKQVKWKYFKPEEAPHQELQREPISGPDGKPVYCHEELTWYEDAWSSEGINVSNQVAYYEALYDTLTAGAPLVVTLEQVRHQIAIMEECFRQNPTFAPE